MTSTVRYPEGWHVNDPSVRPCSAFDPEPFSIDPGTQYPPEVVDDTIFEGHHIFFVGVADTVPFQVYRLGSPQRVVLDVAAP